MPLLLGRGVRGFVQRVAAWLELEFSGFNDMVGPDITRETMNTIGIGFEDCDNCHRYVDDWNRCKGQCGRRLCANCAQFEWCDLCLKPYCNQCADMTHLYCHDGLLCDSCHMSYYGQEFFRLACCGEYVCCGYRVWSTERGYVCDQHLIMPQLVLDNNLSMIDRIREREHASLMARVRRAMARITNRNSN